MKSESQTSGGGAEPESSGHNVTTSRGGAVGQHGGTLHAKWG